MDITTSIRKSLEAATRNNRNPFSKFKKYVDQDVMFGSKYVFFCNSVPLMAFYMGPNKSDDKILEDYVLIVHPNDQGVVYNMHSPALEKEIEIIKDFQPGDYFLSSGQSFRDWALETIDAAANELFRSHFKREGEVFFKSHEAPFEGFMYMLSYHFSSKTNFSLMREGPYSNMLQTISARSRFAKKHDLDENNVGIKYHKNLKDALASPLFDFIEAAMINTKLLYNGND